ncbi:hypothetical protein Vretimale_9168 [Volvox reticuliferus]|uniref:DNA endonuclease activator Ctp1 C-terminal domain-containing protein n=1 Tax=Volvox reticuliferus TaxID=1737510 RepID=A0A8J4LPP9_9CHLO|nr:hypothetical protein Vretifemale_10023 [Volvox reticuliferus]GIM04631.1 hypothetical protein Vretimale_9168 [Volvox reticuliferus]
MALSEVHAVALEAHSAAQIATEVLGRLSAALGTSSQLMGAWIQERDALYARQRQVEQQLEASQQQVADKKEQVTIQQSCIAQLKAQVRDLNSALHAARTDQQTAQASLDTEREELQRRWQELEQQRGLFNLQRQRIPLPQQQQDHQQQPFPQQHHQQQQGNAVLTPMRATRAEQVHLRTPHGSDKTHQVEGRCVRLDGIGLGVSHSRSDSDVSLPPSHPRTCFVDRVPETLFVGYRLEGLFLDAAGGDSETSLRGATAAGASTEAAAEAVTEAAAMAATGMAVTGADTDCGQLTRLHQGTSAAAGPSALTSAAQAQAQAPEQSAPPNPDGPIAQTEATAIATRKAMARAVAAAAAAAREEAAEVTAAAAVSWASREHELMRDHAAQLEAVWAENKALQMDLQNALSYRRISQQLRAQNQALQQQLHDLRSQLEDLQHQLCEVKAAAALASAAGVQSPQRTVVAAAEPAAASLPGPKGSTAAALNPIRRYVAGEQAGTSAPVATRAGAASAGAAAAAAAVPDANGSGCTCDDVAELVAQCTVLNSEREKYREKYREAKQACREARQLARHWQSAYSRLIAAQEGVEAVHGNDAQQLQTGRPAGDDGAPPLPSPPGRGEGDADGTPVGVAQPGPAQIAPQTHPPLPDVGPEGPTTGNGLGEGERDGSGGGAGPHHRRSGGINGDNSGCAVSSSGRTRRGHESEPLCQRLAAGEEELCRLPFPALLEKASTKTSFTRAARSYEEEDVARLAALTARPTEAFGCGVLWENLRKGREVETGATAAVPVTGEVQRVAAAEQGDTAAIGGGDGGADGDGDAEEDVDMTQEPSEGEEQRQGPRDMIGLAAAAEEEEESCGEELEGYGAGGDSVGLTHQPRLGVARPQTEPRQRRRQLASPQPQLLQQPTQKYRSRSPYKDGEALVHGVLIVEQARGYGRQGAEEAAQQQGEQGPQQMQDQRRRRRRELVADCASDLPAVHPVGTRGAPQGPLHGIGAVSAGAAPGGAGNNGSGGGWLNKRRGRSWDSAEANGSGGTNGWVAAAAAGGRGPAQGQPPAAGLSRISEKMIPGRRYVQQQLPFKQSSKGGTVPKHKLQQQENLQRPRLQPSQPWHQVTDNGRPHINFQTGPMDDNACNGKARTGSGVVTKGLDTDCEIVRSGDFDCLMEPPPQKRKALEGAYADGAAAAIPISFRRASGGAAAPMGKDPGDLLTPHSAAAARRPTAALPNPPPSPRPLPSVEGPSAPKGIAAPRNRGVGATAAATNGAAGVDGGGDGGSRDGPGYKYTTVIRGRAERDGLQAVECAGCRAFYEAVATWGGAVEPCCTHTKQQQQHQNNATTANAAAAAAAVPAASNAVAAGGKGRASLSGAHTGPGVLASALRQAGGRHRFKFAPPATPEGFWDIGFGDTQN